MANTDVEICNSALIKVGAQRINALGDDEERARICNEQYPKLRDELLRSHPWNFAQKRIELAKTTNTPAFEFDNEFLLPLDNLRVLKTNFVSDEKFKIEGNTLVTNAGTAKILYIFRLTDVSKYDDTFTEALALRLAADMAFSLTGSVTLAAGLAKEARTKLSEARSFDAQEGSVDQFEAEEFINPRF